MTKSEHGSTQHEDCRLSLIGNSWSVGAVAWLLGQLLQPLGIISSISLQELVTHLTPGQQPELQGLLLRPPMSQGTKTLSPSSKLVAKLSGLVSLKGDDLMLQAQVKYQ